MQRFYVAQIRFTPTGRLYPVNCADPEIAPGERVIVRMVDRARPLKAAEVVSIGWQVRTRQCKHSIVCREAQTAEYGTGPDGVETAGDLHRFLTFLGWKRYPCFQQKDWPEPAEPASFEEWPVAYVIGEAIGGWRKEAPPTFEITRSLRLWTDFTIHVGPRGVGYMFWGDVWDDSKYIKLWDDKLVFKRRTTVHRESGLDPYRHAAERAENDGLVLSTGSPDRSLREIRGAISADGGPAYLGDDVWL